MRAARAARAGAARGAGEGWSVTVRRDAAALAEVADDWDDLHTRCPGATPFQTSAWLASWWREYGAAGALRLVLVRRDGVLVAAAPFHLRRRAGVAVLRPVGVGISDWTDVLIDPAAGPEAATALRDALLADPGWQAVDLPEVASDASSGTLSAVWSGRIAAVPASVCQQLAAAPLDELVATLSSTNRANVRRALRKVDKEGIVGAPVPAEDVPAAVGRLLDLHRRQWRHRGGMTPEHGRPRFSRHLASALRQMVPRGQAELWEYSVGGAVVASSLLVISRNAVGGYLYGAEPELFARVNVTTLLMRTALDAAVRHGCPAFSMMRGREDYKTGWRPSSTRNDRVVLCRPGSPVGLVYLLAVQAQALAIETARAHAPGLRSAVLQVRRAARNPVPAFTAAASAVAGRIRLRRAS